MKLYKLTTQDNKTRKHHENETLWGENVTHSLPLLEYSPLLCTSDVIHAYLSPELAVILNSLHANITNPKLWIAEGDVVVNDKGLKVGCFSLTTLKEIPLPELTDTQRIAFAILCAKEVYKDKSWNQWEEVYKDKSWNQWADKWLSGKDRSKKAAAKATARTFNSAAFYAARAAYAWHNYYVKNHCARSFSYSFKNFKTIDYKKIFKYVLENY